VVDWLLATICTMCHRLVKMGAFGHLIESVGGARTSWMGMRQWDVIWLEVSLEWGWMWLKPKGCSKVKIYEKCMLWLSKFWKVNQKGRYGQGGQRWQGCGLEGTFNWQILGACGGSVKRHSCSLGGGHWFCMIVVHFCMESWSASICFWIYVMLAEIDEQSAVMDWELADGAVVGLECWWVGGLARSKSLLAFVRGIGGMLIVEFGRLGWIA